MNSLSSNWQGLSPHLLAHFRAVDRDGSFLPDEPEVVAPLVQGGTVSHPQGWASPFENMAPESKAPAIAAMLQSGAVLPLFTAARKALGSDDKGDSNVLTQARDQLRSVADTVRSLQGRTSITKLNSTQLYSGSPPAKITFTLFLRAWSNPKQEVMAPLQQLIAWAVPQKLAPEGVIVGTLTGDNGQSGIFNNLLPSQAPQLIYFRYGNQAYSRMVIEDIEYEVTSPRDRNGDFVDCEVNMTLSSLTALDRPDIADIFRGGISP